MPSAALNQWAWQVNNHAIRHDLLAAEHDKEDVTMADKLVEDATTALENGYTSFGRKNYAPAVAISNMKKSRPRR